MTEPLAERIARSGTSVRLLKRELNALSPAAVRTLLAELDGQSSPIAIFVRAYVDGDLARWKDAVARLDALDIGYTHGWASGVRRKRLTKLAAEPRAVEALRAVCVGVAVPWPDAFAVLALDGSDASVDALMPHFARGDSLDLFKQLKVYAARTPAVTRMLARVAAAAEASPALALAQRLQLGPLKALVFSAELRSEEGPRAFVLIDSRRSPSFHVSVDGTDVALETIDALPGVLTDHGIHWDSSTVSLTSNVKGKKRDRLAQWLRTGE